MLQMNFISFKSYLSLCLNENIEYLTDKDDIEHYYRDEGEMTYSFAFIKDIFIISSLNKMHGDAVKSFLNMKATESDVDYTMFDKIYKDIKYEGRLWMNYDTIIFRDSYVPESIINKTIESLKKYFPNKDFSKFKIILSQ